jgi:hypothetical protein
MYIKQRDFYEPTDDTIVWRYMDFAKFMNLLELESMFFLRGDLFLDSYEGTVPRRVIENLKIYSASTNEDVPIDTSMQDTIFNVYHSLRQHVFVNCWHMNDYESAAMWDVYGKQDYGIAIKTTFINLKESFNSADDTVYISKVKYVDYSKDNVLQGHMLSPFLHKRKSFEHEKELRIIYSEQLNSIEDGWIKESTITGKNVKISLDKLIEKIYISPFAGEWFEKLVRNITYKYNLNVEVIKSNMYDLPL